MTYKKQLQLQLFFFNSLLNDLEKKDTFIKDYFNLTDIEYEKLLKKVSSIINLQELLIKEILLHSKYKKWSANQNSKLVPTHIKEAFSNVYKKVNDLYEWYKPYHDEDNLFLCGIRTSFTNPLYWYEHLDKNFINNYKELTSKKRSKKSD